MSPFSPLLAPPAPDTPFPAGHRLEGLEGPIDELRATGRMCHARGWSLGTSSNYSVVLGREPLELLVTASGKDKGALGREDFVRIDAAGRPTAPNQPKSSAETMLHVVLARLPDVGAVLHTHSPWCTVLSDLFFAEGCLEFEGYEMLKGLAGITTHETTERLAIFENTQDIPQLAEEVSRRLAEDDPALRHGFLIRKHGMYTWGEDLAEARRHVEIIEFLLECVGRKMMIGPAARGLGLET